MSILDTLSNPYRPELAIKDEGVKLIEKKPKVSQAVSPTLKPIPTPKVGLFDFLKEIPKSTRSVIGSLGSFAKEMGVAVLQGTAKSGASVGRTLMTPFISEERMNRLIESDPQLKKASETERAIIL